MIRCRKSLKVSRSAQPDLVPHRVGQRLGGDDQRVDRRDRAAAGPRAAACSPRSRERRCSASTVPRAVATAPRLDARDAGLLVDGRAAPFDGVGETADEFAGWIAAQCGVYVAPSTSRRVEPRRARRVASSRSRSRPNSAVLARPRPRARRSCGRSGRSDDRAAVRDVAPRCARPPATRADLADRVLHGAVLRDRRVASCLGGQRRDAHRVQRRAPAAVAPGRAEAGDLGLEDRDAQRRIGRLQVVRRPEPGEPATDDRDVDRRITAQRARGVSGSASWSNHSGGDGRSVRRPPWLASGQWRESSSIADHSPHK